MLNKLLKGHFNFNIHRVSVDLEDFRTTSRKQLRDGLAEIDERSVWNNSFEAKGQIEVNFRFLKLEEMLAYQQHLSKAIGKATLVNQFGDDKSGPLSRYWCSILSE